ncbi:MAG: hypothetical protein LN411_01165 [Candidatus Thermoplasmatota archaeon]|nr:hypothetical protein [Candidatus Thermoplasmatota archaeon]
MTPLELKEVSEMVAKRSKTRKRPFGVTVLAIMQTVSGTLFILLAIILFVSASIFSIIGIILLAIAILSFQLARGYVNGHEWARRRGRKVAMLAILFATLIIIITPARDDSAAPILPILFNIFILAYLSRKRVKKFFK